jgi:hypothetical protein
VIDRAEFERALELGRQAEAARLAWGEADVTEQKARHAYEEAKKAATVAAERIGSRAGSVYELDGKLYDVKHLNDGYSSVLVEVQAARVG